MDELSTLGSLAPALRAIAATPSDVLPRGTVIDEQYEVDHVIGAGAMGVVYLARDRRLERHIALKIVKERSPTALAFASREAVSLARLSHPNVVVIYQVGELDGRVYVAMEYVAGTNAREWAQKQRSISDILEVYLAVGEGLAAAHAAGIIHRDFKPDNVLVGNDGRARIADFGLARSHDGSTDHVVGTPAYMAPEQSRGEQLDARVDQFAFCTAVWETLHGKRPFVADSVEELRTAIAEKEPEGSRRIPRHLDIALRRGLSPDRDHRWPSLAPLLAELRRDPARRRRQVAVAIATPFILAGVVFALRGHDSIDSCTDGAQRIAERWNPSDATTLENRLGAHASWDIAAVRDAVATTNRWTERWATTYQSVCHVDAQVTRDRGMACLSHAANALTATLASIDGKTAIAKLGDILTSLPRPEVCLDPSYLAADIPPSPNPALATAAANFAAELQQESAFALAGKTDQARALLTKLATWPKIDDATSAKLDLALGQMQWTDEDPAAIATLQRAYFEARTAGVRSVAAIAAERSSTLLLDRSRNAEATQWAQLATLESSALGDPDISFRTLTAQAVVDMYSDHTEHAIALMTEALMMLRGDSGYRYGDALQTRAEAYDKHGDVELAVSDANKARDIYARMSDTNLALVNVETDRANFLIHAGHIDEALAAAHHAVDMAVRLDSQDSILVGTSKGALGNALTAAHRYDEALQLLDASLAVDVSKDGEHGYNVASDYNNRCDLLARMHRTRDAIADCKLAAKLWPETAGPSSLEMAETETNLGVAQNEIRAYGDAIASFDLAIKILSTRADDARVMSPLISRCTAHRALDQYAEARRDLDAAKPFVGKPGPADWAPRYELELAYLELHDGHRDRARELATTARNRFAALHDSLEAEAAELLKQ